MSSTALTKARSMGPVADFVRSAGGSVRRVFQRAGLPMQILDNPDCLILLKDQLRLVECAAQETGDVSLGLRLSIHGGVARLGEFGQQVRASPTLLDAYRRTSAGIRTALQSASKISLSVDQDQARASYVVTEPIDLGRQTNEWLAMGYLHDIVDHFAPKGFAPTRIEMPGRLPGPRRLFEELFGCEVTAGDRATLVFPAHLLSCANPGTPAPVQDEKQEVPAANDLVACVTHLIRMELLDARPRIDGIARRMGLSRRSLQRGLLARGRTFDQMLQCGLLQLAREQLAAGRSVTDTALALGYSDPAHFSRAYQRWTGQRPSTQKRPGKTP